MKKQKQIIKKSNELHSVLGIDPGLTNPGYCFLGSDGDASKSFIWNGKFPLAKYKGEIKRCSAMHSALKESLLKYSPAYVVVEQPAVGGSLGGPRAGLAAGMWMGMMYSTLNDLNYTDSTCVLVPPSRAKKFLTGKGNASKTEVALAVYKQFGLNVQCDAEADAVAIAYCGWHIVNNVETGVQYRDDIIRQTINEGFASL